MDPRSIYFPEPEDIAPLAMVFAKMMFAHARFEAEVRSLQGTITGCPTFGEQPRNRLKDARRRPAEMAKLIKEHLGDNEEAERIVAILNDAIAPCDRRNLLVHGEWWFFDPRTSVITVRAGTQWEDEPQHVDVAVSNITSLVETFETLDAELYKLRRSIEARLRKEEDELTNSVVVTAIQYADRAIRKAMDNRHSCEPELTGALGALRYIDAALRREATLHPSEWEGKLAQFLLVDPTDIISSMTHPELDKASFREKAERALSALEETLKAICGDAPTPATP
jgi:hypothetical protein